MSSKSPVYIGQGSRELAYHKALNIIAKKAQAPKEKKGK